MDIPAELFVIAALLCTAALAGWHLGASLSTSNAELRWLEKPQPLVLIRNGHVNHEGLRKAGLSLPELLTALRKAGCRTPRLVRLAILDENQEQIRVTLQEYPAPTSGSPRLG